MFGAECHRQAGESFLALTVKILHCKYWMAIIKKIYLSKKLFIY